LLRIPVKVLSLRDSRHCSLLKIAKISRAEVIKTDSLLCSFDKPEKDINTPPDDDDVSRQAT
jgi:hypothetical protein